MTSELSPSRAFPGALVLPHPITLGPPARAVAPAGPSPSRAPIRLDLDRFERPRPPPSVRGVDISGEAVPATPHARAAGEVRLGVDLPLGPAGARLVAGVRAAAGPDGAQTQRLDLSVTGPRATVAAEADIERGRLAGARGRITVPVSESTTLEARGALGADGRPTTVAAELRYAADGERLRAAITRNLRERTTRVEVGYQRDLGQGRSIELSGARDLESRATSARITFRRTF